MTADPLTDELNRLFDVNRIANALERIATALEQNVLDRIDHAPNATFADPYPSDLPFPVDDVVELPPVTASFNVTPAATAAYAQSMTTTADVCPIHHVPWKTIPAGTSKRTGNAYAAFRACSVAGCDQRPKL